MLLLNALHPCLVKHFVVPVLVGRLRLPFFVLLSIYRYICTVTDEKKVFFHGYAHC